MCQEEICTQIWPLRFTNNYQMTVRSSRRDESLGSTVDQWKVKINVRNILSIVQFIYQETSPLQSDKELGLLLSVQEMIHFILWTSYNKRIIVSCKPVCKGFTSKTCTESRNYVTRAAAETNQVFSVCVCVWGGVTSPLFVQLDVHTGVQNNNM